MQLHSPPKERDSLRNADFREGSLNLYYLNGFLRQFWFSERRKFAEKIIKILSKSPSSCCSPISLRCCSSIPVQFAAELKLEVEKYRGTLGAPLAAPKQPMTLESGAERDIFSDTKPGEVLISALRFPLRRVN